MRSDKRKNATGASMGAMRSEDPAKPVFIKHDDAMSAAKALVDREVAKPKRMCILADDDQERKEQHVIWRIKYPSGPPSDYNSHMYTLEISPSGSLIVALRETGIPVLVCAAGTWNSFAPYPRPDYHVSVALQPLRRVKHAPCPYGDK